MNHNNNSVKSGEGDDVNWKKLNGTGSLIFFFSDHYIHIWMKRRWWNQQVVLVWLCIYVCKSEKKIFTKKTHYACPFLSCSLLPMKLFFIFYNLVYRTRTTRVNVMYVFIFSSGVVAEELSAKIIKLACYVA